MQEQQEALLIGYLIAGDPNADQSLKIMENVMLAGLDILELGIPSRNPYMDGSIIQSGHARVNANVEQWFIPFCRKVRRYVRKPIWVMSYKADLFQSNLYEQLISERLIDALLVPDCTYEENYKMAMELKDFGVDVVQFVQPTMSDHQIVETTKHASIVYAQTYTGTTGAGSSNLNELPTLQQRIRRYTSALLVAGFGLKTPDNVRSVVQSRFDGAVVGSAFVEHCVDEQMDELYELVSTMKQKTDLYEIKG
jgi:tryptophan synthase alpha chain